MKHIPKENIKVSLSVGFLASLQDRHNERYSAEDMSLFQSLCSAYKACCPTSTVETAAKPVVTAKADNRK